MLKRLSVQWYNAYSMHAWELSHVQLFATPCTVACQAPLSMGLSSQQYWSGLPFPPLRGLPNPGTEPASPALEPPGKASLHLLIATQVCPPRPGRPLAGDTLHANSFPSLPSGWPMTTRGRLPHLPGPQCQGLRPHHGLPWNLPSETTHPKVSNKGSCTHTPPREVCPSMSRTGHLQAPQLSPQSSELQHSRHEKTIVFCRQ